jgi:penicillin-binding protein-related factor A (putative recombinase)
MPVGDDNNPGPWWPDVDPSRPTQAKRAAGRKAQDRGKALERDIRSGARPMYVYLQPTPPPWRYVRRGRQLVPVVEEAGVPDFHAAVNGRAVVCDAKATGAERWSLSHLTVEQAEHLAEAEARGVVAGVLLRFDASASVYWLPWPRLAPAWWTWHRGQAAHGDASLTEEDAAQLGVRIVGLRWWEGVLQKVHPGG